MLLKVKRDKTKRATAQQHRMATCQREGVFQLVIGEHKGGYII